MEHFHITRTEKGLHVEGIPQAVKLIHVDGPKAKRLADLALHKDDLEFANECLQAINKVPAASDITRTLQQALWRSAVVHFMKCFGTSARFQLSAPKIYKKEPVGLIAFQYFKDLRNKHFIHDENSYAQSLPGAAINDGKKRYKVEKIVCLSARGETLEQANYANLELLIRAARDWVVTEFDQLCVSITAELEKESYDNLASRKQMQMQSPKIEQIGDNRRAT